MSKTTFDSENKLWCGNDSEFVLNPNVSAGEIALWFLKRNPSKVAQISDNNDLELTNAEISTKTIRAALHLQVLGFRKDDVFGVMARNHHYLTPIVFSAFCMGCPVNALNPASNKIDTINVFKATKPKVIFCDVECYDVVKACVTELNTNIMIFVFGEAVGASHSVEELFMEISGESDYKATDVDGINQPALIICSSGSTGKPKNICISHAMIVRGGLKMTEEDGSILIFSTLQWVTCIITLMSVTIYGGTRIITTEEFSPETFLRIVEQRKVTSVLTASLHTILLLKCKAIKTANLSTLRKHYIGGSSLAPNSILEYEKHLPNGKLHNVYGMSEVGQRISINETNSSDGSTGQLDQGIVIKIIDDDKQKCGIGQRGEVCVKAAYKSLGYYNDKKATAEMLDDEGFILTGDIGYFDEKGNLFLVGRKKEIFKYYGIHISPSEIEDYLNEQNDIQSVCVVDIPDPEGIAPHLPAAVVVRKANSIITAEDIKRLVIDRFTTKKELAGGVYFCDKLPTTATGKIMRKNVREMAIEFFQQNYKL